MKLKIGRVFRQLLHETNSEIVLLKTSEEIESKSKLQNKKNFKSAM